MYSDLYLRYTPNTRMDVIAAELATRYVIKGFEPARWTCF